MKRLNRDDPKQERTGNRFKAILEKHRSAREIIDLESLVDKLRSSPAKLMSIDSNLRTDCVNHELNLIETLGFVEQKTRQSVSLDHVLVSLYVNKRDTTNIRLLLDCLGDHSPNCSNDRFFKRKSNKTYYPRYFCNCINWVRDTILFDSRKEAARNKKNNPP